RGDYWNRAVRHYEKIIRRGFQDPTSTLNAVRAGESNYAQLASAASHPEPDGPGRTLTMTAPDLQALLLQHRAGTMVPLLGDVRVRQAINHAIDRPATLEAVALGYGTVTTQVFPTTSDAYDEALDERYPYDLEKAKELMAEAGCEDGFSITMPN